MATPVTGLRTDGSVRYSSGMTNAENTTETAAARRARIDQEKADMAAAIAAQDAQTAAAHQAHWDAGCP